MPIVSFFDQLPEYNGQRISIRGKDGYFSATDMSRVLKKRLTDWRKTKFAVELLDELSIQSGISVDWENSPSLAQTPLIDYVRGDDTAWLHPYVALSYAMSNARFQARVNIWIVNLMTLGTVNPHVLQWTLEEIERGVQYNRDDINEMYH